jgi:hypothetical protein
MGSGGAGYVRALTYPRPRWFNGGNVQRVTYPHFGTLYVTIEHYFRALGLEPVTPPYLEEDS